MIDNGKLYDDLDLPHDATAEQIKAAYRAQSKQHHPDAGGNADAFARISAAYAILGDQRKRIAYDAGRDPLMDTEAQATKNIVGAFVNILNGNKSPETCDLVGEVRKMVKQEQAKVAASNRECDKYLKRFDIIAKRLKGEGVLRDAITSAKQGVDHQRAQNDQQGEIFVEMLAQLDGWDYEHDAMAAYVTGMGASTSGSISFGFNT